MNSQVDSVSASTSPGRYPSNPTSLSAMSPSAHLDVSIQAQIINLLLDLREKYHLSYLFISHDLSVVSHIAKRIAVDVYGAGSWSLDQRGDIIFHARHPYTKALISAVPRPGVHRAQWPVLEGSTPSLSAPLGGCCFHPPLSGGDGRLPPGGPRGNGYGGS